MVSNRLMPGKILLIYDLKGNDSQRILFNRRLFHYNMQSHEGRYKATSRGILKEFEKPVRSVVIFEKKYLTQVFKLVKNTPNLSYSFYEIVKKLS